MFVVPGRGGRDHTKERNSTKGDGKENSRSVVDVYGWWVRAISYAES